MPHRLLILLLTFCFQLSAFSQTKAVLQAANGGVTPTEVSYLDNVTSAIQTQLDAKLTTTAAASTYQPLATLLTSFSGLSNAPGLLTNNGSGIFSYTSTSTGGFGAADTAKIPVFDSNGGLTSSFSMSVVRSAAAAGGIYLQATDDVYAKIQPSPGMSTTKTFMLGTTSGTLAITADISKSAIGLGSVENTALSTWAGSANITQTGTVTSGTWSGSFGAVSGANLTTLNASNLTSGTVPAARLGSGTANSTTYLRGDNTWQTISSGGVTSITGTANEITVTGTTTPTLSLPSALTFTGKTITGGTFVSPTASGAITVTGGTVTSSTPALDITQTWNNGAVTFTGMKMSIIRTAAASASMLFDFQQGGTSALNAVVNSAGNVALNIGSRGATLSTIADYSTELNGYFGMIISQNTGGVNCIGSPMSLSNNADTLIYRESAAIFKFGADAAAPITQTLKAHDGSGINKAGADLQIQGGRSTGNATPGKVIFRAANVGSSGSSLATYATRLAVSASGTTIGANGTAVAHLKRATVTLVAGTATVSDTDTTANTQVSITVATSAGTVGTGYTVAVSAGTGYTITAIGSVLETSSLVLKVTHF